MKERPSGAQAEEESREQSHTHTPEILRELESDSKWLLGRKEALTRTNEEHLEIRNHGRRKTLI